MPYKCRNCKQVFNPTGVYHVMRGGRLVRSCPFCGNTKLAKVRIAKADHTHRFSLTGGISVFGPLVRCSECDLEKPVKYIQPGDIRAW